MSRQLKNQSDQRVEPIREPSQAEKFRNVRLVRAIKRVGSSIEDGRVHSEGSGLQVRVQILVAGRVAG